MENKFLIYTENEQDTNIPVVFREETIWATQKTIAELFEIDRTVVTKHLKNIFESKELDKNSVCAFFAHTASDGKSYKTQFYNLDAIISVGYRVNSEKATKFRIWATNILRKYMIKGYVLDKKRLKNGKYFGKDYFDELVEEIREIRASERRFYQKVTDIYATSVDYDKNSEITKKFFATVQNKLHFATHNQTAPELIVNRANSEEENMGLSTWKNSPEGKILKNDVFIAKNYLTKDELSELNKIVNMYLDYAEDRAKKEQIMTMEDWAEKLDSFLKFNERRVLKTSGEISKELAHKHAEKQYEKYRILQDQIYENDFDLLLKENFEKYN